MVKAWSVHKTFKTSAYSNTKSSKSNLLLIVARIRPMVPIIWWRVHHQALLTRIVLSWALIPSCMLKILHIKKLRARIRTLNSPLSRYRWCSQRDTCELSKEYQFLSNKIIMLRWIWTWLNLTKPMNLKHLRVKLNQRLIQWSSQSVAHKKCSKTTRQRRKYQKRTITLIQQTEVHSYSMDQTKRTLEILGIWCKDHSTLLVRHSKLITIAQTWIQLLEVVINLLWTLSSNKCNSSKTIR